MDEQRVKTNVSFCQRRVGQTRFRDDKRTSHQQTSCVLVFKHTSNRGILTSKEMETLNELQKRSAKQSHAREHGIGVQSTLSFSAVKNGFSTRCQFSFLSPTTN